MGRAGDLDIACCRVCDHQWQYDFCHTDHDDVHRQGLQSSHLEIESIGAEHARRAKLDTLRRVGFMKERAEHDSKLLDGGQLASL